MPDQQNDMASFHPAARWIWNDGEASPRNQWWCFRKTFEGPREGSDSAILSISADSRYVLFINGERIGRGPVRSWPFRQHVDQYEIGSYLKKGEPNCIAVLVMHFGLSTFYYLRGRGGLLAQIKYADRDGKETQTIVSDGSWKTERYAAQDARAPRMSTQNAFAEVIDARRWPAAEAWTDTIYNDDAWLDATEIGSPGMKPWTSLITRPIPFLTEEPVYPIEVSSAAAVQPVSFTTYIDLRNHMVQGSEDHMNSVQFCGYLLTNIKAEKAAKAVLGFTNTNIFGRIWINGALYSEEQFYGEAPEKYVEIELQQGNNLFLMDITGSDHAVGFYMGVDCEFGISLESPLQHAELQALKRQLLEEQAAAKTAFITLGPFATAVNALRAVDLAPDRSHPDYQAAAGIRSFAELARFDKWIRTIPEQLVSDDNLFSMSVWRRRYNPRPVMPVEQQIVTASFNSAAYSLDDCDDTELVIDFGKEESGFLVFEVDAPEGAVLDFCGFEYMNRDQRQHMYKLNNTLRYICRDGRQRYVSPVRRGFRYLSLTIRKGDAGKSQKAPSLFIRSIHMLRSTFPVANTGQFQCSDTLLNQIYEISRHTVRLCMEDAFVDCPGYEQAFWVGDSRNSALESYYLFGAEELVKFCLELVPGSASQTPFYASQVPSGWENVLPNWTFFWVLACHEYVERTGDMKFAAKIWPHVQYTLDHYLTCIDDRGLYYSQAWNLLDWAAIDQPNDGVVSHQNMILVKTLRVAADLAECVESPIAVKRFAAQAAKLQKAVNQHLWSVEEQAYMDCIHADGRNSDVYSMQTQVIALICHIPEGERQNNLAKLLVQPPQHFVQIGSPFMSFFYYEALAAERHYDLLLNDIREQYGFMLEHGATTCWEMFPNSTNRQNPSFLTRSHCHAWSAAPAYFLGAEILGIKGASPGWRKVVVEPQPCDLKWAKGSVPLPDGGKVYAAWRVDEAGQLHIEASTTAPAEVELEIRLPAGYQGTVTKLPPQTL